jgi:hypothetical protein
MEGALLMPDNLRVRRKRAVPISASPASQARVTNAGPDVVYYKAGSDVSADDNDGELALNQSLSFESGTYWFLSAGDSRLFATYTPDATTDMATQAELDEAISNGAGALKAAVEANGKGYVNHGEDAETPRPEGFASIEWHGALEPENAIDGDTWIAD